MTYQLEQLGYKKGICKKCGNTFWSKKERDTCGDAPCDEYQFINNPITDKKYDIHSITKSFKSFFKQNDHTPIKRYPVLAKRWRDDVFLVGASIYDFQPWVTSGMAEPPANPLVIAQPSIRLNDVDNVGRTGRHMTCFTMGAHHAFNKPDNEIYWKNDTLRYCHEYLVSLGINEEEITYIESWWKGGGNEGPSFEICAYGVELATLVFIQYETQPNGELKEIPLKIVDTGYGLERIAWVSQGTPTAYDATFGSVIDKLTDLSGVELNNEILSENARIAGMMDIEDISDLKLLRKRVAEKLNIDTQKLIKTTEPMEAIYVVADHTRCLSFMLADGVIPSNVKEGYLARLVLRRTIRFMNKLNLKESLSDMMQLQVNYLSKTYPEIKANKKEILSITDLEEERYYKTVNKGSNLIKRTIKQLKKENKEVIPNDMIMNFYDSHGIPPETVERIANKENFKAEISDNFYTQIAAAHETEKIEQKEENKLNYPETKLDFYDDLEKRTSTAKVLGIEKDNLIILDRTIFYPEGGGQPTDKGTITLGDTVLHIEHANKKDNIVEHRVIKEDKDKISPKLLNQEVILNIDSQRRLALTQNHTATHLVIASARKVLGKHIWQAGAQKGINRSRIDLSHYKRITSEELKQIETLANQYVRENHKVNINWYTRTEAERKYGFKLYQGGMVPGRDIRVIHIEDVDVQACAGTHLDQTGKIGLIKLLKTERVQDGVERLEYSVGNAAINTIQSNDQLLTDSSEVYKIEKEQLPKTCQRFFDEWKLYQKKIEAQEKEIAQLKVKTITENIKTVNNKKLLTEIIDAEPNELKEIATNLTEQEKIVDIAVLINNKGNIIISSNKEQIKEGLNMNSLLKEITAILGGKGGGKPNLVQGAKLSTDTEKIEESFQKIQEILGN
ncbi:MAG: alanine--tRNA ligase [Methanobacteriaceae archaeon]|nr:alanine--tRNA ligase [Methanobacteriaceae archaeon]